MATITKTVRFEERFLHIVEDYTKIIKMMFGNGPTVNGVLSDTIVKGFEDNIKFFRFLMNNEIKVEGNEKFDDEIKEKVALILRQYDELEAELFCSGGTK